jgi:N,N'-diacetyllegionaminate synthase
MKNIYVIAEVGINHNGDINIAKEMVLAAKKCGANCVKFQTFKAMEFVSDEKQLYTYRSQGIEVTESMMQMFKRYEFTEDQWKEIVHFCKLNEIEFCSTAQNLSDLKFLLTICDLPFIKVGSDDLTNVQMLKEYAKYGKKMIISAGMAFASEIEDAVEVIRSVGNNDITVLHCVSSYPAESEEVNLKKIPTIKQCFDVEVGYSDHTIGSAAAIGAVCFGATVIEKHFTLNKEMAGPDHWFASNVEELSQYVMDIRSIEKCIGVSHLFPTKKEMAMRDLARRKIILLSDMKKGEILLKNNIDYKRAIGDGLPPKYFGFIVNRKLKINKYANDTLTINDFE